jgi:DedD protein
MEKRKLLLISISVGIFLVIVIGASILLLSPPKTTVAVTESIRPIRPGNIEVAQGGQTPAVTVNLTDMVKDGDEPRGLQPAPSTAPATASTIQENNNHIYINGKPVTINGEYVDGEPETGRTRNSTNLVINVPAPQTPAVSTPERASPAPAPAAKPVTPAPRPKAPAAKPAAARPTPPPSREAQGQTNFWVQTGAFSTQNRAEGVKEILAAKGISSIIENRNVDGKTFYRVRVGPYTSNSEATYWLALIKQINGFENSQIWQNQSRL